MAGSSYSGQGSAPGGQSSLWFYLRLWCIISDQLWLSNDKNQTCPTNLLSHLINVFVFLSFFFVNGVGALANKAYVTVLNSAEHDDASVISRR